MTTLKINCQLKIFEMIFILTILYNIPREIFFVITSRRIILFEKLKINYTKIIILIFIIIKKIYAFVLYHDIYDKWQMSYCDCV